MTDTGAVEALLAAPRPAPWDGQWVADRLGVTLTLESPGDLDAAVGLALRCNPRRVHLLVSRVLGKHVPADPRVVRASGLRLGGLVRLVLDGRHAVVLGYAETATGLGHAVADRLDADCLHSTRRRVAGVPPVGGFEEEHSHATSHLLLPEDATLLTRPGALVLVDDELSTGHTAMNTIAALHERCPRDLYVLAALVDVRAPADEARLRELADRLNTRIVVVATARGRAHLPDDLAPRAAAVVAEHAVPPTRPAGPRGRVRRLPGLWPAGVREGGRHGFTSADRAAAGIVAGQAAGVVSEALVGGRVLVLGCEELMHAPTLIAAALAELSGAGRTVRVSSTTRSPVVAVDEPGYPIRTALAFPSHDAPSDGPGTRYAYNVAPAHDAEPFTDIVLVVDGVADTPALSAPGGLLDQLASVCHQVLVLVLPSHRPHVVGAR